MSPLQLTFVLSETSFSRLPHSPAEVAVVGRSNVGKSSLLNALSARKKLARVSNTPGRTRLLNLFQTPEGSTIMDLPGYGYAAVSKSMRYEWQEMIEEYLLSRENLVCILVLVDGLIGPTELDQGMIGWLRSHQLPYAIIATKQDKVKSSKKTKRKKELANGCSATEEDIFWVSAAKGNGVEEIRKFITTQLDQHA